MAMLTVRNLSEEAHRALRVRAAGDSLARRSAHGDAVLPAITVAEFEAAGAAVIDPWQA